jgi:hypothetical protein
MKSFTQKALFIVLTVFVLVGLFYGLTTPVKGSVSANVHPVVLRDGPVPVPCPEPDCPSDPQ